MEQRLKSKALNLPPPLLIVIIIYSPLDPIITSQGLKQLFKPI